MARATIATLTFRIEPGLKEALRTAAERECRSIANRAEVMIREYCGISGIAISDQPALAATNQATKTKRLREAKKSS